MTDRVYIFDTTLRDGEQSPGCSMNIEEKVIMAKVLDKMGVDVIEAGFPAASAGDFEAVRQIAENVEKATVVGLCRAKKEDIDKVAQAIKGAKNRRIHTFIATSEIHMKYKLNTSPKAILEKITKMVAYAKSYCDDIEFSAEDATRSDKDFLCEAIECAIEAGATVVNIPDTVGYTVPEEYAALITYIKDNVSNIDKAIISVHCHDDLGLANANSLAGIKSGARQVEVTVNGIGERAGNAALEEVVMAIKKRGDVMNVETNIDTTRLIPTSEMLTKITGIPVQPNKAIVGANAFAHESGIHQDGMLKNRETYEIISPEEVGADKSTLVFGKHSGSNAVKKRLSDLEIEFEEKDFKDLFVVFKEVADAKAATKETITDDDLRDIFTCVAENNGVVSKTFVLGSNMTSISSVGSRV